MEGSQPWTQYVWVSLGGGLGALARFTLGAWIVRRSGASFPVNTLLINVTGSLAIGVLLVLLTERFETDPAWRLFLVVGFLGGYTTFSSYSFEAVALLSAGEWMRAAWYVLGSNGLALLACAAGMVIARFLTATRA
jgi:fluoride exporter